MRKYRGFIIGLLIGCAVMFVVPVLADSMKQYVLTDTTYPVMVNDVEYESTELPILNYQGNTYIPMKAIGDILGVQVTWNALLHQAEIYNPNMPNENNAFRNVQVMGTNGAYTVTGEARVFEAVMNYEVSDGHFIYQKGVYQVGEAAPTWSAFTLDIQIPADKLPKNDKLTISLFEESAKDGNLINILTVLLEDFSQ